MTLSASRPAYDQQLAVQMARFRVSSSSAVSAAWAGDAAEPLEHRSTCREASHSGISGPRLRGHEPTESPCRHSCPVRLASGVRVASLRILRRSWRRRLRGQHGAATALAATSVTGRPTPRGSASWHSISRDLIGGEQVEWTSRDKCSSQRTGIDAQYEALTATQPPRRCRALRVARWPAHDRIANRVRQRFAGTRPGYMIPRELKKSHAGTTAVAVATGGFTWSRNALI